VSAKLNKRFLTNPIAFAGALPLVIEVTPGDTILKARGTHNVVASASRVVYWDINLDDTGQYHRVTIKSQWQGGYVPGYWLPWKVNDTNKITLVDKRRHKTGGTPLAFFTAQLTGCSIVVQGNRMTPTVYHTNARDSTFGGTEPTRKAHRAAIQEARLSRFDPPKRGGGEEIIVHAREYMSDAHPDVALRLAQQYQLVNIDPDEVLSRTEAGMTFGVLNTIQGWKFYLHRYLFLVSAGVQGAVRTWQGLGCQAIDPNGVGRPVRSRGGHGTTEIGASGRTLLAHVDDAIVAYTKRWHFNQSDQTAHALGVLRRIRTRGYLYLLSVVHYYLGLDDAPVQGVGAPLSTSSEFYADLRGQYERWLSG